MSQHTEEASIRGHGPRAPICNHEGSLIQIRTPPQGDALLLSWCSRCGVLHANGEWRHPSLAAKLLDVVRSFRMTETVEWRQELLDAALAGIDSPDIQTAPRYVPIEQYEAAVRDRDTMCETLTIAQARGTELVEEVRALRAKLRQAQ